MCSKKLKHDLIWEFLNDVKLKKYKVHVNSTHSKRKKWRNSKRERSEIAFLFDIHRCLCLTSLGQIRGPCQCLKHLPWNISMEWHFLWNIFSLPTDMCLGDYRMKVQSQPLFFSYLYHYLIPPWTHIFFFSLQYLVSIRSETYTWSQISWFVLHPLSLMSSLVTSLLRSTTYEQVVPHDTKTTVLVLVWLKMCKVKSGRGSAKEAQYCGALQHKTEGIHCLPPGVIWQEG